ncbi:MAG: hypothetical protein ACK4WH_06285 [Phycisphaerales bacterium]
MNRAGVSVRCTRRGGAYVLVLGAATLLTVAGLSAVAVMRTSIGRVVMSRDWSAAGVLAESSIEGALSRINTEPTWRSDFRTSPVAGPTSIGGGTASFRIEDPSDGDLSNNPKDPVRIIGVGKVGQARRAYAVEARWVPPPALEVLNHAVYATGSINCRGAARAVGGGIRCAGTLTNSSTLLADVWASSVSNSGTIAGEVREGGSSLSPLSDGTLASLASRGTVINYGSLSGGSIDRVLLSPGANPYGAPNADGIYVISVPALSTLTIRRSRIVGTLVVQLGLSSSLQVRDEVNWERSDDNLPTLIVSATALSSVGFSGSSNPLSEGLLGVNFNPASTPYNGQSDTDTADTYPTEVRGVIHISTLLASVTCGHGFTLNGTLITEGSLTIDAGASFNHDATVLNSPPAAYQTGSASMMPVPGTWSWVPVQE